MFDIRLANQITVQWNDISLVADLNGKRLAISPSSSISVAVVGGGSLTIPAGQRFYVIGFPDFAFTIASAAISSKRNLLIAARFNSTAPVADDYALFEGIQL
jgi:hypothetical protein